MGKKVVVRKGDRYGKLSIVAEIERDPQQDGSSRREFSCLCDCGKRAVVRLDNMRSGNSESCGCDKIGANRRHGLYLHPAYKAWNGMRDRCKEGARKHYDYYARGIHICDEWKDSPAEFIKWAELNGFEKGLELDRRDNNKGYSPSNCRFVTSRVNEQNRRNSYYWFVGDRVFDATWQAAEYVGKSTSWVARKANLECYPHIRKEKKYSSALDDARQASNQPQEEVD